LAADVNEQTLYYYYEHNIKKNYSLAIKDKDFILLESYSELIIKWGKVHNIISANYNKNNIYENIFDSIIGSRYLGIKNIVYDAGSGGGFPAIPIAILYPESRINMVESNRKKCSFLRLVKSKLNLKNVEIFNTRIENIQNVVFMTTKAAFSPPNVGLLAGTLAPHGNIAIWSTPMDEENFVKTFQKYFISLSERFDYEVANQQRCLLLFSKN
jgi:16S rRNA (guanine527-N7)-methyltransferase